MWKTKLIFGQLLPLSILFQDMIDHRSYVHSLSSCEIKAWKNSGFKRGSFALSYQAQQGTDHVLS